VRADPYCFASRHEACYPVELSAHRQEVHAFRRWWAWVTTAAHDRLGVPVGGTDSLNVIGPTVKVLRIYRLLCQTSKRLLSVGSDRRRASSRTGNDDRYGCYRCDSDCCRHDPVSGSHRASLKRRPRDFERIGLASSRRTPLSQYRNALVPQESAAASALPRFRAIRAQHVSRPRGRDACAEREAGLAAGAMDHHALGGA
jgi:hypothetical protein